MTSTTPLPRRRLLRTGLAASAAVLLPGTTAAPATAAPGGPATPAGARRPRTATAGTRRTADAQAELRSLEQRYEARLGVHARNVRTGLTVSYRAQERFAMCSTFKTFAAAAVLRDHDRCAPLDKVVLYPPADVLANSPVTEQHVDTGMTVGDLCAAAIQYSDNTAGNLLLRQIGGPPGLTGFLRSIGDTVSRLDRWETELNAAVPGDPRDTTTPEAIGRSLEKVTLTDALDDGDRARLVDWLKGNTTSGQRFRAGLPRNWVVADKTGTGEYASANDIGVAWTTVGTPLVLTVLSSKATQDAVVDNALIESAARILADALAPGE